MSAIFISALLLELVSLLLLRHRLGREWWRRPGSIIVLASVIYDGVSPLLLAFPSIGALDTYRIGIKQSYVDEATLIMAAGMLAFTLAYLATRPERTAPKADREDLQQAMRVLDWRVFACALVPLAVLTYRGKGFNNAGPAIGAGASLTASLSATFFLVLMVLTAFSVLLRFGKRWFFPVLVAQSLLLAAAGERSPIFFDAVALLVLMGRAGNRPSLNQVRLALAVAMVAMVAITGVRAEKGRSLYTTDTGLGARVVALGSGITGINGNSLIDQAAVRLDGVDFAGGILQAQALGDPRLSASGVPESLLLLIPSVLWPPKLAHRGLNPGQTELNDFGLQQVNFLPGLPGLYIGFLTPLWLAAFLAVTGWLCGLGERFLYRSVTPVRLVLLAGALGGAIEYEAGLPMMLTALRAAVVIALAVKVAEVVYASRPSKRTFGGRSLRSSHRSRALEVSGAVAPLAGPAGVGHQQRGSTSR